MLMAHILQNSEKEQSALLKICRSAPSILPISFELHVWLADRELNQELSNFKRKY